eukprot:CAMPEP_0114294726 /NCGR_PEP_ID=MMETSP0059-20121206/10288_1 /TAXON_ID=36894 /ORGANISM="Pyramimonas parkeae, Strain CCMP726" /LENGTH=34 /DNA_ID= /DNA_START= /DNA_END= /DNA_ORIENTATION=
MGEVITADLDDGATGAAPPLDRVRSGLPVRHVLT